MFIETDQDLANSIERMRLAGTDLSECELKDASGGIPKSLPETISAFANTSGGSIVLGVSESSFLPAKHANAKILQAGCAQAVRELVEPPVAADIRILQFKDAPVVVANIPESSARQKPCFVKKRGQRDGSFIRTGDGDHHMSQYELDRFIENQLGSARNDTALVEEATIEDLDDSLLRGWLARERSTSSSRISALDDEDLMANRRIIAYDENGIARPTIAGLMALGSFPQKFFPRLNVVFTHYPTSQKGDLVEARQRFVDSSDLDGPIPDMVIGTLNALSRNIRHGAIVKGALREDVPDYPLAAVREAVANALMHRDYSPESQGTPVEVNLYPDRLEIINPGGLYGSLTVERLGTRGGTTSRNQYLSVILAGVPYTDIDGTTGRVVENRGTGYPIITGELQRALMEPPLIVSSLDEFRLTFRHRRMTEQEGRGYSRKNVERAILALVSSKSSASTSEIAKAAGISGKTARGYINRLIDEGIIEGIGSKYSPQRRYRLSKP